MLEYPTVFYKQSDLRRSIKITNIDHQIINKYNKNKFIVNNQLLRPLVENNNYPISPVGPKYILMPAFLSVG